MADEDSTLSKGLPRKIFVITPRENPKNPNQNASKEGKLVPIKLVHPNQEMGNYTPKKPYLWSGVVFLSNSKTQNQQFGVLWL